MNFSNNPNKLLRDLEHILEHTGSLWEELRNQRIFITGGTGFFGCWLLESFLFANNRLGLNAEATVLTRNPEEFQGKAPHLAFHPSIHLYQGDIRNFSFPKGNFSHIIHAATEASAKLIREDPGFMLDTIVAGTQHTLEFAKSCGARKLLLTSSGAVYGKQPTELTHVPEDYPGAPSPCEPGSSYGEGKRIAELLCAICSEKHGIETKIARCFAFVGPYLPLDIHYAIGNFIRDGLVGRPIQVQGDGTPYRSYLYAADMMIWLWTILIKGESRRPYNVGSEKSLTIEELARTIAQAFDPEIEVEIAGKPVPGIPPLRYVPATERARTELDLRERISLAEAIHRTVVFHKG